MGNKYADSWIDLLYDVDTEVRITSPSREVMKVHGLRLKKYLVLPGTDRIFPDDVFNDDIVYESKTLVKPGSPMPTYERKKLEKCKAGEIYPVTIIQKVTHIHPELKSMGIPMTDGLNQLTFEPGELEQRMSSMKRAFLTLLESSGLTPEEAKIYYRLVTLNLSF